MGLHRSRRKSSGFPIHTKEVAVHSLGCQRPDLQLHSLHGIVAEPVG